MPINTNNPPRSATFGRGPATPPGAPEVYVYKRRVHEADVLNCLRDLGDQALADYKSGKLSRDEAYRQTATWLRNAMEMP